MKRFLIAALLAAGGAVLPAAALAQAVAEAPVVTVVEITRGLYLMEGGGGANSSVLAGADGVLVVDSKLDLPSADAELRAIGQRIGETDPAIRYLLNTHVHPDHTGGNERYGELGAVIVAHEDVHEILAAGQRGGPPAPEAALPDLTFGDGGVLTLHVNGETVRFEHMPAAHTTDNSMVHFVNANVFHLGDLYSPIRYPVMAGGSLQGFLDALDIVMARADAGSRFIPGNGQVTGLQDIQAYRAMLVAVRDRVEVLVSEGRSLEEVIEARPTAEFDATWGSPERFLPALYRELSAPVQ